MKKQFTLLAAGALPLLIALGACGDDTVDADDIIDDDGGRKDATTLPDARSSSGSSGTTSSSSGSTSSSSGSTSSSSGDSDAGDGGSSSGDLDAGDGGSSSGDLDAGDGGGLTEAEQMKKFAEDLADAYCTGYEGCCGGAEPQCRESPKSNYEFFGGLLSGYYFKPAVATGDRVDFDAARAQSCLTKVRAMGCLVDGIPAATWKDIITTCGRVFVGTGEQGATCYADIECTEQFACAGVGAGANQPGTCQPLIAEGELYRTGALSDSCSWSGLALDNGLFADRPLNLQQSRCRAPRANDAACEYDQQCGSYACSLLGEADETLACEDIKQDPYLCLSVFP